MTTVTTLRQVDAEAARLLQMAYRSLVRAGRDSVRASWRFGETIDSLTDDYTRAEIAVAVGVSLSTIYRYLRLFHAYQRPELAVLASTKLETFNIDVITELRDHLGPVKHARPAAGRRYRFRCAGCGGHEVHREEITEAEAEAAVPRPRGPVVVPFRSPVAASR